MLPIFSEPTLCQKCRLRPDPEARPCARCSVRAHRKSIAVFALMAQYVAVTYKLTPAMLAELVNAEGPPDAKPLVFEVFRFLEQAEALSKQLAEFTGIELADTPVDAATVDQLSR